MNKHGFKMENAAKAVVENFETMEKANGSYSHMPTFTVISYKDLRGPLLNRIYYSWTPSRLENLDLRAVAAGSRAPQHLDKNVKIKGNRGHAVHSDPTDDADPSVDLKSDDLAGRSIQIDLSVGFIEYRLIVPKSSAIYALETADAIAGMPSQLTVLPKFVKAHILNRSASHVRHERNSHSFDGHYATNNSSVIVPLTL
ncbi:hypothetical protein CLF_103478 [Clonorchis sinensis]|uniref:Uncharacterized protein n=1 Tax=Clonorchis sinensis TaxID=79923 RepID=G7Y9T6_CLOSI|nr:hypothetical protein CLF_103478 [Clonorchis sinensis]